MKYNKNEVTGKMRDRIILQNVTRVRSLSGFASESWADIATIWAFAESKLPGSNETIIDGKNTAKNICDFTIRYISTITEESRVVWGDKLYQVKNLKVSHDRRFISFTGVFYDSYILTGVNVAASVNGIATTSANLKLIMSVIGQANAIASSFADLTVFQQGAVDVAASVNALGTITANLTKVININSSVDATANVNTPLTISKNISSNVGATATSVGNVQLVKLLSASVDGNATAISILDVVTQGIVLVDASVTATGETTANVSRIVTLASSPTTAAETSATAILTKVLEASATASAETSADAQITIPVNALATATAETSATAQLTYTVNASADATALTSAEAQIVRIISAEATAMAESSAEASFGVTFVANVNGTATVTNASVVRTATMAASVTGAATVTSATLDVLDSNAKAFFNRVTAAGGSLTSTEQNAVDTLVKSLKSNGVWTKMKAIYPMVGSSASACAQNLKSASYTGSFVGAVTFSSNGILGNSVSGYMNTNFNTNTELTLNNSHISLYSRTQNADAFDQPMKVNDNLGNDVQLSPDVNGASVSFVGVLGGTQGVIATNTDCRGMFLVSRTSATLLRGYKNTTTLGTNTTTGTHTYPNLNLFLLGANANGILNNASSLQIAFATIGDGLSDADVSNLYSSVQTFQTTLNRQI
jgi:SPP1 family predicted phage head-tail adaptor